MNDDLNIQLPPTDPPDAALLKRISEQLAASPKAVRPLPSNSILWAVAFGIFVVVSVVLAAVIRFKAFDTLSGWEMLFYYGVIAVLGAVFARAVIERMIPGEPHRVNPLGLWGEALFVLGVLVAFMYSDHSRDAFVSQGIPCFRTGVISAFVSGSLGWRLLRRGYLVSPRETLLLYGFFAGLVGVAVLALHCPIRNSLHFIVWHLGAMVLAGIAGLLLGRFVENRDYAN